MDTDYSIYLEIIRLVITTKYAWFKLWNSPGNVKRLRAIPFGKESEQSVFILLVRPIPRPLVSPLLISTRFPTSLAKTVTNGRQPARRVNPKIGDELRKLVSSRLVSSRFVPRDPWLFPPRFRGSPVSLLLRALWELDTLAYFGQYLWVGPTMALNAYSRALFHQRETAAR